MFGGPALPEGVMNVSFHPTRPVFRVSLLQPLSFGRARVVESWVTDGNGAIEALELPRDDSYAIQVEMEDWRRACPPGPPGPSPAPSRRSSRRVPLDHDAGRIEGRLRERLATE